MSRGGDARALAEPQGLTRRELRGRARDEPGRRESWTLPKTLLSPGSRANASEYRERAKRPLAWRRSSGGWRWQPAWPLDAPLTRTDHEI